MACASDLQWSGAPWSSSSSWSLAKPQPTQQPRCLAGLLKSTLHRPWPFQSRSSLVNELRLPHLTGAWIWTFPWQFWSVQESSESCRWDSDLPLTCRSFDSPLSCRYVGVERSLVWVRTIPPPPCTNLAPNTDCDFAPNSSGEEPLRSCSSDPKREQAPFHWPSWHSECPLVWGFQFWGSSCTRGNTSYACWPLPFWSFSPRGSSHLSHIETRKCSHKRSTRLRWRLPQTMPCGSQCAPADTYAAPVSISRGFNLDPALDSPGGVTHTIFSDSSINWMPTTQWVSCTNKMFLQNGFTQFEFIWC